MPQEALQGFNDAKVSDQYSDHTAQARAMAMTQDILCYAGIKGLFPWAGELGEEDADGYGPGQWDAPLYCPQACEARGSDGALSCCLH